ncbi:MAG: leucine-rich repeat protein [Rikenellaceae bacterium]
MKSFSNLLSMVAVLCMALLVSCENSDDLSGSAVALSEESLEVNFTGNSSVPIQIAFTSYQKWEASTTADWLEITPSSGGAGSFIVTLTADANQTDENRQTTVDILSGGKTASVTVNQSKINVLTIDGQTEFTIDGLENEVEVEFTTNNSFEILIPSTDTWVSLKESSKATESYTRTFAMEANPNYLSRTSTITISNSEIGVSETISITQTGCPIITPDADPAEYELTYLNQDYKIELFSTVDYEVVIDADDQEWLSAVMAEGGQSITFSLTENEGDDDRVAEVSLACDAKFGIDQKLKIVQKPFDVVITPDLSSVDLPRESGEFSITVDANVDIESVIAVDWIREISCVATGLDGQWIYTFEYDANSVLEIRYADVQFYNAERDKGVDVAISQEEMLNTAVVTVTAAGEFATVAAAYADITAYDALTIIGEEVALNVADITAIKLFTSARIVDISQTATASIHGEAFANNTHIEEFIFPNTLTTLLGTAFMSSALTKVTIPGSVTTWGNAVFTGCTKIKEVIIEEGCIAIGQQAFLNNTALVSVSIPSTMETWLTIADAAENKAFGNCTALKNLYLADGLKRLGTMSFFNTGLEEVTIPGSITDWPLSSSSVNNCFTGCSSLKTVTLGDGLYAVEATALNALSVTSLTSYSATPPTMTASGVTASANVKVYVPSSYITAYSATSFWSSCTVSAIEE